MDLTNLIVIALSLVALVTAVVEIVKATIDMPKRFLPLTSLVAGIVVALIVWPLSTHDIYTMLVVGLIAGLAASGTFDALKAIKGKEEKV